MRPRPRKMHQKVAAPPGPPLRIVALADGRDFMRVRVHSSLGEDDSAVANAVGVGEEDLLDAVLLVFNGGGEG